jgi:dihydrofolate synthase/folylpolyglutamate synthase
MPASMLQKGPKMIEIEIAYQEALDYLYSFIDYSLTRNFRYTADKFNLGRMFDLLDRLGNPQRLYPIIHVAGTKGKGSTAAMMASALQYSGYRTGFYTSPHLSDFTERIQVNGVNIPHADVVYLVNEIKPHVKAVPFLTTFELMTALSFMYFERQNVNAAVVEVGLGGRLDATNVVEPLITVITSLSLDHMNVLGDTLAKIATEKAGIIKKGVPIVLSPQKEEARIVIERIAAERDAPLTQVGRDYLFSPWSHSLDQQSLLLWSADEQSMVDDFIESGGRSTWEPLRLSIPLLGYHQVENAATAYATLQVARKKGLKIPEKAIKSGFAEVFWPGRFEVLRQHPPLIIDSAHNQDSALKLRLAIADYLPHYPVILIFGVSEDKDVRGMFSELLPSVKRVITTQSVHPRAMDANEIVELAHQFGKQAQAIVPVEDALATALEIAGDESAVVATGSLFIAAAVREAWILMNENKRDYAGLEKSA